MTEINPAIVCLKMCKELETIDTEDGEAICCKAERCPINDTTLEGTS